MTDVVGGVGGAHPGDGVAHRDALIQRGEHTQPEPLAQGGLADQDDRERGSGVHVVVGQQPDRFELMIVQQVGFVDFSDRGRPDYASDLRLCVDYMFAMLAWRCDTRWCRGAGRDVGPADQRAALGSARRASRSAIRRSWKRRLERAALRRSSRVQLSAVSWRTRCLRVVFSVVTRWIASWVHSASRSRMRPSSSPIRVRWAMISWLAVLSACSALSVRSRQLAAPASCCLSWRRSRWVVVCRMALATAVFASELV